MTNTGRLHWLLLLLETAAVSTTTGSRFSGATSTTAFENALCFCESKMSRCEGFTEASRDFGTSLKAGTFFFFAFHPRKAIT